jgi:hypothetical protein
LSLIQERRGIAKSFSCWIGRHSWTTRKEQGESYKVCSTCGKTGDIKGDPDVRTYDLPRGAIGGDTDRRKDASGRRRRTASTI